VPFLVAYFRANPSTAAGSVTFQAVGNSAVVTLLDEAKKARNCHPRQKSPVSLKSVIYISSLRLLGALLFANI
jgi:hypothetical protein